MSMLNRIVQLRLEAPLGTPVIDPLQFEVVEPAVEVDDVADFDTRDDNRDLVNADFDFDADRVIYAIDSSITGTFSADAFAGFIVADAEGDIPAFNDVRILETETSADFRAVELTVEPDEFRVNLARRSFGPDSVLALGVGFILNGTSGDDVIAAGLGPDLIRVAEGDDVAQGSTRELDGDVIEGFGFGDAILVEDARFGADDLEALLTETGVALRVDLEGTDSDFEIGLTGDFSDALFRVEELGGATRIRLESDADAPGVVTPAPATGATEFADRLFGTDGPDVIDALGGDDVVKSFAGDDAVDLGPGDDIVLSGDDDDLIFGGDGRDVIKSGAGSDRIDGGAGDDVILSGDDDDLVFGGDGNDTIKPGRGNDVVIGGAGDDVVAGFRGDERFDGGEGNDRLLGSVDDDTLIGGEGDDRLWGGPGFDTFVFEDLDFGHDTIPLDFRIGSDTLDFTAVDGLSRSDFSIRQVGANVVLEVGEGSLVMNGVRFGGLDADEFIDRFDEVVLL